MDDWKDVPVIDHEMGIITDILRERRRQDEKWGEQDHPDLWWQSYLLEEFGEAAEAINERRDIGSDSLEEEIIDMAAVCVAWLRNRRQRRLARENEKSALFALRYGQTGLRLGYE